VNLQTLVYCML